MALKRRDVKNLTAAVNNLSRAVRGEKLTAEEEHAKFVTAFLAGYRKAESLPPPKNSVSDDAVEDLADAMYAEHLDQRSASKS